MIVVDSKKGTSGLAWLGRAVAVAAAGWLFTVPAAGETLVVCSVSGTGSECRFSGDDGIQQAVDAAAPGDTVRLEAGTYRPRSFRDIRYGGLIIRGYVLIDGKDISISGTPGVVLDGAQGVRTSAIVVRKARVSVSGLTIRNFRVALAEDDNYDGHGIFVIDSHVTLNDIAIRNVQKMALSIRGASTVAASRLCIADNHLGIWMRETATLTLRGSAVRGSQSAGIAAYADTRADLSDVVFANNHDDGIYTDERAKIRVSDADVHENEPFGLHADGNSRITAQHVTLQGNGKASQAAAGAEVRFLEDEVSANRNLPGRVCAGIAHAQERYAVTDRIAGPDGGYDYISFDTAAQRVFVARDYGVMAIDLKARKVVPRLIGGADVSAVLMVPDTHWMLSTNWSASTATLFDRRTGEKKADIETGTHPDGALFESVSGRIFVMNSESGDISVIDPQTAKVTATIAVGGKPEAAASDERGHVFVNIENTAELVAIDVARMAVSARYKLPDCIEPTGLAYVPRADLLVSACHNGTARLTDAETGQPRGAFAIGKDADGAVYDSARELIFIPSYEGTLTIAALGAGGKPSVRQTVKTQKGARTVALDPATGRLFLPAANMRDGEDTESVPVPGTFKVLVVAPD